MAEEQTAPPESQLPQPRVLPSGEQIKVNQLAALGIDTSLVEGELANGCFYPGKPYGEPGPAISVFYAVRNAYKDSEKSQPDSYIAYPETAPESVGLYETSHDAPLLLMDFRARKYRWVDETGEDHQALGNQCRIVSIQRDEQGAVTARHVMWEQRSADAPSDALFTSTPYRDSFVVSPRGERSSGLYSDLDPSAQTMIREAVGPAERPTYNDDAHRIVESIFTFMPDSVLKGDFMEPERCAALFRDYAQRLGADGLDTVFDLAERVRMAALETIISATETVPRPEDLASEASIMRMLPNLERCFITAARGLLEVEQVEEPIDVHGQSIPLTRTRLSSVDPAGQGHTLTFIATPTTPPRLATE